MMIDRSRRQDDLIAEAATHYVRLQGRPKSWRRRKALSTWIGQSEEHARAMDLVCRLWVASKVAATSLAPAPPIAPTLIAPRRAPSALHWLGYGLVGGFGVVAASACAIVFTASTHYNYSTQNYKTATIAMADGTAVIMAPRTDITIDNSLFYRHIYLNRGIVDIKVGRSNRKLHTYVRGLQIDDLGTRFVVENQSARASVALISGEIAIRDVQTGKELSRLRPGTAMTWANMNDRRTSLMQDTYTSVAWENHVVEFDNTPLPEAVEKLHDFTGLKVHLEGRAISKIRISGTFNYNNPNTLFHSLMTIYGARVMTIKPNEYVIKVQ